MATPSPIKFQGTVTGCNPKTEHSPVRYTVTCPQFAGAEIVFYQPVAILQPVFRINDLVEITVVAAVPAQPAVPAAQPAAHVPQTVNLAVPAASAA